MRSEHPLKNIRIFIISMVGVLITLLIIFFYFIVTYSGDQIYYLCARERAKNNLGVPEVEFKHLNRETTDRLFNECRQELTPGNILKLFYDF